ncbi:31887_t:CDS:1, partial [Racocetra persica]
NIFTNMPTSIKQKPDLLDLDAFYQSYVDTFGIVVYGEELNKAKSIPAQFKLTTCITKTLCNYKATHFFPAPTSTATIKCLCGNFHTQFISSSNKQYILSASASPTTFNNQ